MDDKELRKATFAGGCFWCLEPPFEGEEGVVDVTLGFSGGEKENPSYEEVASGATKHLESVQVTYDPSKISYRKILNIFWRQIDPTDPGGQFADRGRQYATAIFYHNEEQRKLAENSRDEMNKSGLFPGPIVTNIRKFESFYPAEEEHQGFHRKNKARYKIYEIFSGRKTYLKDIWGGSDMDDKKLRKKLSPMQYKVTQEESTEPAFDNEYWDNYEEGIYVDVVSGEPLFSSKDKFDSESGWPSFTKPIDESKVEKRKDFKLIVPRTEVRSARSDSHLGHVFKDGPEPTGLRYCINSAALRFIPKKKLEEEGYEEYLQLF